MIRYYYALVTHVDREIGRLVECLQRQGTFDETIFVVNSDHGEMLGNHGFVEKCLMYEESVRVPCLVSWPVAIPERQRVAAPLGGVDLVPTLLELAGLPVPETMDGRSLAAEITAGRAARPRPAGVRRDRQRRSAVPAAARSRAVRGPTSWCATADWKYVWNRFDGDELYRLDEDPAEMKNLAQGPGSGPRIDRMRCLITGMLGNTGPGLYEWCLHEQER